MNTTKSPRLILRTLKADMTSYGGFAWKASGVVVAPDWSPSPECGGGLHGLLNGQGKALLLDWSPDAVWIVATPGRDLVDLGGKVKCKRATVVYCGDRAGALAHLRDSGVTDALPGDVATAGDWGTATAGHRGTATAGDYGTATAGVEGAATAGYGGTIVVKWSDGYRHRITVGYVGEDGVKAGVAYRCDPSGRLVVAP